MEYDKNRNEVGCLNCRQVKACQHHGIETEQQKRRKKRKEEEEKTSI